MTILTHTAFAVLLGASAQASYTPAVACALGSALPDLDHPRSAIGRLLFFISIPLSQRVTHRKETHSFLIWLPLLVVGLFLQSPTIQWIAIGACSHILIDCYNTSGCQAFWPLSERVIVCFKKDWRINVGSTQEIVLCAILIGLVVSANYAYALGGPRRLINLVLKSPQITMEEFQRAGNLRCYAQGQFRWADGRLEDVQWLIVGTEGVALAFWNGQKIVHRSDGEFLSSTLIQSKQDWPLLKSQGILHVAQDSFYFLSAKWHLAKAGQKAMGTIKAVSGDYPQIQGGNT